MKTKLISLAALIIFSSNVFSQPITVKTDQANKRVVVSVNGKPFTSLLISALTEKPVLYPIYANNGEIITRGFPLEPRDNEQTDHPHHVGLWLNYESVNGLDFWNNSSAIPANKKAAYGSITNTKVLKTKSGKTGLINYTSEWQNIKKEVLLRESTILKFSQQGADRIIDRITTLTAVENISMPDIKDGFLGLRVTRELEMPSNEERKYVDNKGIVTKVKASTDPAITGNYLSSEGAQGDAVWGTRARWCLLYGKKGADSLSVAIIDHPQNVGYPTYWHARGYGLFAANPLGQKVFSNGKESLNFKLKKGKSVVFKYRVIISSGKNHLDKKQVDAYADGFSKLE